MTSAKPTRQQADLAEVLEMVLDKGIVINADIAITVGDTELLGIEIRAAIASFETAAKYGLAFPSGTDMRRVRRAAGQEPLEEMDSEMIDGEPVDLGIEASAGGERLQDAGRPATQRRPRPKRPFRSDDDEPGTSDDDADADADTDADSDTDTDDGEDADPADSSDGENESRTNEDADDETEDT